MPTLRDLDARMRDEARRVPVQRVGAFGQRAQRIERRDRARQPAQRRDVRLQRIEQLLVQPLFARQRPVLRRQRLVLECLQLGRDEALGVLQRLPATVVVGHFPQGALRHLYIEAVHAVELHPQVRNARALALGDLQFQQEFVAVLADRAQFVQFGIVAGRNDAAIAHQCGRLRLDRDRQQIGAARRRHEMVGDALQQRRTLRQQRPERFGLGQRDLQRHQLSRTHLAQRDAGGNALDVAGVLELLPQGAPWRRHRRRGRKIGRMQRADGFEPRLRLAAVALRRQQPALQAAAAHAGHAGVEQGEQRRRLFAAQRLHEFEVAARGRRQVDQVAVALDREPLQMRQHATLRVLRIADEGGRGGMRLRQRLGIPGREAGTGELLAQLALAQRAVELPGRPDRQHERRRSARSLQPVLERGRDFGAVDQLARRDAGDPGFERVGCAFGQTQFSARHAEPGQPADVACARMHGEQQRFGLVVQQLRIGQRAGRDHAHHLALDRPLAQPDFADLLADRDGFAELDEAGEVGVDRVERDAAHRNGLPGGLAALRERDVEEAGGFFCVGVEELVEVAHPVEEEGVWVICLQAEILGHHRRVLGEVLARLRDLPFFFVNQQLAVHLRLRSPSSSRSYRTSSLARRHGAPASKRRLSRGWDWAIC